MTGLFAGGGLRNSAGNISKRLSQAKTEAVTNVWLWGSVGLGVLLRFVWVGKREFWYDEVLSVLIASGQKSAYKVPENLPFKVQEIAQLLDVPNRDSFISAMGSAKEVVKGVLSDPHPPLFYLAQHGWMWLFGNGEAALRLGGLLLSVATIWMAYVLGRKVLGHRGGLIFTALLSLNPFFMEHSLNLRMYAPMVLWVIVSSVCLLCLFEAHESAEENRQLAESRITQGTEDIETSSEIPQRPLILAIWRVGLAASLTAGLMTQYLFAYWLFAISALALYLDRKHWLSHALTIGASLTVFAPWVLWGVRQQASNRRDVLTQISSVGGPLQSALQHGKDVAQTLANHLLIGHLTTGMLPTGDSIKPTAVAIGCGVIGFLGMCIGGLYRRRQYRVMMVGLIMGVFPLLVALAIDSATNKYTVGFGWGRSVMVALPGCLLLVSAWLTLATGRWREPLTALLLAVYLGVNVGDFGWRDRQIFHAVSAQIPHTQEPVLVAMNTKAWGHVLRLAYYLSEARNTEVLATNPAEMPAALAAALAHKDYSRVLWLNAKYPLWGKVESAEQAEALVAQSESLLKQAYPSENTTGFPPIQVLRGTMYLDRFDLQVYDKNA